MHYSSLCSVKTFLLLLPHLSIFRRDLLSISRPSQALLLGYDLRIIFSSLVVMMPGPWFLFDSVVACGMLACSQLLSPVLSHSILLFMLRIIPHHRFGCGWPLHLLLAVNKLRGLLAEPLTQQGFMPMFKNTIKAKKSWVTVDLKATLL